MGKRGGKALYNYFLNIAIDICLKTMIMVRNELKNIDGRISVNQIEPKSCGVYLFLTKSNYILPIMKIILEVADTELENNEIAITIIGKLEEQEHDTPFADVSAKSILDDYQNLKPWVKEGIVHRIGQLDEPKRIGARSLEVRYRMHDELYPEVDEFANYNIDEERIAKSLIPYIKSLQEIYSRIYPTSNCR
jgi:hypothetical protein